MSREGETAKRPSTARLESGKVVAFPDEELASYFEQRGYGVKREDGAYELSPHEALYLLEDGRIRVVHSEGGEALSFFELLSLLGEHNPDLWIGYLIYRDLRKRGYVVRNGFGFGLDFRVYERGEYGKAPAKYIVVGICEGSPIPVQRVWELLKRIQSLKRELVFAVVDRRSEVVYYTASELTV